MNTDGDDDGCVNWKNDPVFDSFKMSTFNKIYVYFLDKFGCLLVCSKLRGRSNLAKTKERIDKAYTYMEKDFDLKRIMISIKESYKYIKL
jgi:hypothetical protein